MAKFNTAVARRASRHPDIVNKAGGAAYKQSDKHALVSQLLTSFVQDQFYRNEKQGLKELFALLDKVDPKFSAKAAIFARNEFGMRSITHVVGATVPYKVKGERWTKHFVDKVVRRPDDATEILAYYLANYGKPVPNSLKKGLALSLEKFDGYQLAKYRGDSAAVSLIDVVNLSHPKPSEKNAEALGALVDGDLRQSQTWESRLSEAGKSSTKKVAKAQAWGDLIASKRLGYFGALKNIRNVAQDAPESLDALLEYVQNKNAIKNSLVLPFRFLSAYDAVAESTLDAKTKNKINRALNKALDHSFDNVPVFGGDTLVAIDGSSSMTLKPGPYYGGKSPLTRPTVDYAAVFAAALLKKNDADLMRYEARANYVDGINPDDTFTTLHAGIKSICKGGATNVSSVFDSATKAYDRIVILSDNESWLSRRGYGYNRYSYYGSSGNAPVQALEDYKRRTKSDPFVYAMNLAGYGELQFPEKGSKVANISGFSEKVFDVFKLLEQDRDALIKKIEAVEL